MDSKQLEAYLGRIGLSRAPAADAAGLAEMQRAHLRAVPFENLDIVEGRLPLALDEGALFDKVVVRRRGGICYELNLLFAAALRALGFDVELKGGRHPKHGDDMDHLFMLVRVPDDGVPRIADVGFAYNFAEPLLLAPGALQDDGRDRYLVEGVPDVGEGYLRIMRVPGLSGEADAEELYAFGPRAVQPADCRERCDWYCTAPESRFTQGPLVCLDAPDGRRTLSARHLTTTCGTRRETRDIATPEDFAAVLRDLMP